MVNYGTSVVLFSNPASTKRENMVVKVSPDEGKSWPQEIVVHTGSAAYSSLVHLVETKFGLLYEKDNYSRIAFVTYEHIAFVTYERK